MTQSFILIPWKVCTESTLVLPSEAHGRVEWKEISARAAQHLQGFFFISPDIQSNIFFPGTELSHNFFKLRENF